MSLHACESCSALPAHWSETWFAFLCQHCEDDYDRMEALNAHWDTKRSTLEAQRAASWEVASGVRPE